jgi:starch synthase
MKVALLTREFPPAVYGGAGVHVAELARALDPLVDVEVLCFEPGEARAYAPWDRLDGAALRALSVDLAMAQDVRADVVHSHTWYANLGGHLAKLLHGIPHVVTLHSLEPQRPWKAEQLGAGGYALSCFCERTAVEAADAVVTVSAAMREDVLRCYPAVDPGRVVAIHNGVDAETWQPDPRTDVLERLGVDPARPLVLFVGRIARQKGIEHLLAAASLLDPGVQLVLAADAPDTRALEAEVRAEVAGLPNVLWFERPLTGAEVAQLATQAACWVVPSVYEPLGIVNLEAMACATAVVASAVGGIPEVVVDGETGFLVPPGDAAAIAARVNELVRDPALARRLGEAGRRRAVERFGWRAAAERTVELYAAVTSTAAAA